MTLPRSTFHAAALCLTLPVLVVDAAQAPAAKHPLPAAAVGKDEATRAAIQRAVDAVYPALVRIHVVSEEGAGGRMQKSRSTGSGAIVSEDGYILTNHHVAGRGTRIVCRLSNREEVDAELIGTDALSDLAVLKLDLSSRRDPKAKLGVARFGDSDKLKVGDTVLAMGSPAGLSQSVTMGIVANTAMISPGGGSFVLDGERVGELVRWIGHDAVIFPGNSGGPLVNLQGEIIGVNEVGIGSLGGAIPGNLAQTVMKELMKKGKVSRSWIGVEVQPLLKTMTQAKGVLVGNLLADSPASRAGLKPGDIITDYNGQALPESRAPEDIPIFNRYVLNTPLQDSVVLKGMRDQKPMTWRLTTVEREPNEAREMELGTMGLTVRDFTRVSALEAQRAGKRGVLVDSVRSGGPSAEAKPPLRSGDIIVRFGEHAIADVKELNRRTTQFTNGLTDPKPVLVTFERGLEELVAVAKIGPEARPDRPARPAKAWIGVETQVITRDLAEVLDLAGKKGVRVTKVNDGSPAANAGVKVGDVFLKLDGDVINASTPADEELFGNLIRQHKVGAEAELEGSRAGKPLKLTVKLGGQPKPSSELEEYRDERFEFTARDLSHIERLDAKLAPDEKGVRIGAVQNAGWAALAGLASGDILFTIDGQPVESVAALRKQMNALFKAQPRRVVFFVKRGIRTGFIELEPKW